MAGNVEPSVDLEGDSSGDFVLPARRVVSRKNTKSPPDVPKVKAKGDEEQSGGLTLNSCFSVNKVRNVLSSFVGQKKHLVESIGFGGLMSMHKQTRISRRLAFWLLRNMDNASTSIVLRDGVKIHVKDADVNLVLGLPHKLDSVSGKKISLSRAAELVKINLGLGKHEDIRMEYIENLLIKDYSGKMSTREKIAFKVAVVLFVDAYFLAPKSSPGRVNHSVLPYLVDADAIHVVNWSAYVLRVAKEASIKVKHALSTGKKSVSLDCCLLFLEVFYLDNLDTRYNDANPLILPRVAEFPYERIKQIMKEDTQTSKDGKSIWFGKLKVKPSDQTVYGSDTSNVSPCQEATDEEIKNYVMSRFLEFKEQLDDYRKAYVDQIEDLFVNLDYAMTEYVATACKSANKGVAQECSELTVACVQGQRYPNPISPKISNEQLQTPTLSTPAVSILEKFEAIDITSPVSPPDVNLLKKTELSMSPAIRSYGVYSAGPSFDQSADRESGDCRLFLDGNSIIRSSLLVNGQEQVDSCPAEVKMKQYPKSTFMILLEDQVIPKTAVLLLQQELEKMSEEELERYWFVHKTPTNISLNGRRLREEFTCIAEWTVSVVDAISRLLMHLDDLMYDGQTEKRWRHFLPSSWSEVVLHEPESRWVEETDMMFRCPSIKYNVEDCRMVNRRRTPLFVVLFLLTVMHAIK